MKSCLRIITTKSPAISSKSHKDSLQLFHWGTPFYTRNFFASWLALITTVEWPPAPWCPNPVLDPCQHVPRRRIQPPNKPRNTPLFPSHKHKPQTHILAGVLSPGIWQGSVPSQTSMTYHFTMAEHGLLSHLARGHGGPLQHEWSQVTEAHRGAVTTRAYWRCISQLLRGGVRDWLSWGISALDHKCSGPASLQHLTDCDGHIVVSRCHSGHGVGACRSVRETGHICHAGLKLNFDRC